MNGSRVGIIGLGKMGGGIAKNMLEAGINITVYDMQEKAVRRQVDLGAAEVKSIKELMALCEIVFTCVLGRSAIPLTENELLPLARQGQIFVELSTISVPAARRFETKYRQKGAWYLDACISGGSVGAEAGLFKMFIGGPEEIAKRCWPIFEAIGDSKRITYCGPAGYGQAAKVVQQLAGRFTSMARVELLAFAKHSGLEDQVIRKALGLGDDPNDPYERLLQAVNSGKAKEISFEFPEWEFYLDQAKEAGFRMPMLEGMYEFCKDAKNETTDGAGRPEPSVWNLLLNPENN